MTDTKCDSRIRSGARTCAMTNQQSVALANPCEHAMQCINQRYRNVTKKGKHYVSVLLTVNVGEE